MDTLNDYQFEKAASFDHTYREKLGKINPSLRKAADAFIANIDRVRNMAEAPGFLIYFSTVHQLCADRTVIEAAEQQNINQRASWEWFKSLDRDSETYQNIRTKITECYSNEIKARFVTKDSSHIRSYICSYSAAHINVYSTSIDPINGGLHAILKVMITETYTAFEVLAGDLWEAAVNSKPDVILKRLTKQKAERGREVRRITLEIETDWLSTVGFSLQGCVGTMLRHHVKDSFSFGTLQSISDAFLDCLDYRPESLDSKKDRSLFNLSKTRNAIVHRAGKVDQEFYNDMVNTSDPMAVPSFAGLGIGQDIPIDGDFVNKLLSASIQSAVTLITDIDKFI